MVWERNTVLCFSPQCLMLVALFLLVTGHSRVHPVYPGNPFAVYPYRTTWTLRKGALTTLAMGRRIREAFELSWPTFVVLLCAAIMRDLQETSLLAGARDVAWHGTPWYAACDKHLDSQRAEKRDTHNGPHARG